MGLLLSLNYPQELMRSAKKEPASDKPISFITGNRRKFLEARKIVTCLRHIELDLPEIQELDPRRIIRAKLLEARKRVNGALIVEDTSLRLDCLNGLPGPLIIWFLGALGNRGIYAIAEGLTSFSATAALWIGLADVDGRTRFFCSSLRGEIASPAGRYGFGWDPIFRPRGYCITLAEMTFHQKNEISMRAKVLKN